MPIRRATTKKCATCRYWSGKRNFFIDGKGIAKYNLANNEYGLCSGEGNFKGQKRIENMSCICYSQKEER